MKRTVILLTALLLATLAAGHAIDASSKTSAPNQPRTFCNPLPVPNYPVGFFALCVTNGRPDTHDGWYLGHHEQFRELADPMVLWHEGTCYLNPSGDMAWVSADNGATWHHHPLNVREIGSPTKVVWHRSRFLLGNNSDTFYASADYLDRFVNELPKTFNPKKFDTEEWTKLTKEAGMKYLIITSKHHEGFDMDDSKVTNWDIVDARPYGKDLLKPLADACHKEGIKLGFYCSQVQDWNTASGGH